MDEFNYVIVAMVGLIFLVVLIISINAKPDAPPSTYIAPRSPDVPASVTTHADAVYNRILAAETEFCNALQKLADQVDGEWFNSKVVGINHRNPGGGSRVSLSRKLAAWDELSLQREADNPVDPNAVSVYNRAGQQVGYLPRDIAAKVSPSLARGIAWRCFVKDRHGVAPNFYEFKVALLHAQPAEIAIPDTFVEWMNKRASAEKGWWMYLHLVGLHKENEDGVPRRVLLGDLHPREELSLIAVHESDRPPRVLILDGRDQVVAQLSRQHGFQYIRELKEGFHWRAYFECVEGEDYETPRAKIAALRTRTEPPAES